jgi:hypothetical protein
MNDRKLQIAMMLGTMAGTLGGFWMILHVSYNLGIAEGCVGYTVGFGREPFNRFYGWLYNPSYTFYHSLLFMGFGLLTTLLLMLMRMRFLWWPFHPVGYAISGSWSMNLIWFQMLISSAAKWVILRHGGIKLYRQSIPFFLGLILGEFVIGGSMPIFGVVFKIPVYTFW